MLLSILGAEKWCAVLPAPHHHPQVGHQALDHPVSQQFTVIFKPIMSIKM